MANWGLPACPAVVWLLTLLVCVVSSAHKLSTATPHTAAAAMQRLCGLPATNAPLASLAAARRVPVLQALPATHSSARLSQGLRPQHPQQQQQRPSITRCRATPQQEEERQGGGAAPPAAAAERQQEQLVLAGEDAAVFDLSQQSLRSWAIFGVLLTGVAALLYPVRLV